jgi:hypothetical protein
VYILHAIFEKSPFWTLVIFKKTVKGVYNIVKTKYGVLHYQNICDCKVISVIIRMKQRTAMIVIPPKMMTELVLPVVAEPLVLRWQSTRDRNCRRTSILFVYGHDGLIYIMNFCVVCRTIEELLHLAEDMQLYFVPMLLSYKVKVVLSCMTCTSIRILFYVLKLDRS